MGRPICEYFSLLFTPFHFRFTSHLHSICGLSLVCQWCTLLSPWNTLKFVVYSPGICSHWCTLPVALLSLVCSLPYDKAHIYMVVDYLLIIDSDRCPPVPLAWKPHCWI